MLLPIVVICKAARDANTIDALNDQLRRIGPRDYGALLHYFDKAQSIRSAVFQYRRFYAVRYGMDMGIWVNFKWYVALDSLYSSESVRSVGVR